MMSKETGMRVVLVTVILFSGWWVASAGDLRGSSVIRKTESRDVVYQTGNLRIDLFSEAFLARKDGNSVTPNSSALPPLEGISGTKSPLLAAALSAAVPGSGEFYSKSYLKSATFFGAEVATWIVYGVYTKRGNDRTVEYEDFANVHWSVVDYTIWMNRHKDCLINVNPDESLPPQDRLNWENLNACERAEGFSHILPPFDTQQYYELIGKYAQYTPGWDDSDTSVFIDYSKPENLDRITPRFGFYRDMRGDANELLDVARLAINVVVLNHVLSAFDAAWSASRYNRSLQVSARVQIRRLGEVREIVPTIDVKLSF